MTLKKLKQQAIEIPVFICLILIGFKISGSVIAIDWSWWLVFSPLSILVLNYIVIGCVILYKLSIEFERLQHERKHSLIQE